MPRMLLNCIIRLLICFSLVSCASRLPERTALDPSAIPNLKGENSRIFIYMGYIYMDDIFDSTDKLKNFDGLVFVNDKEISYVNEDAIIIDLPAGTYEMRWLMHFESEFENKHRYSAPYQLTAGAGETIYLEANVTQKRDKSLLAILGGPIGGAIAGTNVLFTDYFRPNPDDGPKQILKLKIADYIDLSGSQS